MIHIPKWMTELLDNAFSAKLKDFEIIATDWIGRDIRSVIFHGDLDWLKLSPGMSIAVKVGPRAFRNYTPSFIDEEEQIFQIMAHTHGGGPGASCFANIQEGQSLPMSMARGMPVVEAADHHYLFGDESALGLACWLEWHFKSLGKHFFALLHLDEAHLGLPELLGLSSYELVERSEMDSFSYLPPYSIFQKEKEAFLQQAHFVLAGNGLHIQQIKKELVAMGIDKKNIQQSPFWVPGKSGL